MTGPNWSHASKSMDELHPPTCHVIWGCGIWIMTIFQLYYNQCNIGTCHVIEERHGILEFLLLFNYIITNEHWHVSHGHLWSTIKLNYLMCAMCTQNLEIIDLLKMSAYDIMPCGHLCYTLAWHMASCYL